MIRSFLTFATYSRWTGFHISMLAALLTGAFMAASAEDLGAIGPIILSLGICVIFFAIVSEICLFLRFLISWGAKKVAKKIDRTEIRS